MSSSFLLYSEHLRIASQAICAVEAGLPLCDVVRTGKPAHLFQEERMDTLTLKRLEDAGIATEELLERCMGNAQLAGRLLRRFAADGSCAALCAALQNGDREGAIAASHTMKGLCANLSMKGLQALCEQQLALLRAGRDAEAAALMGDIDAARSAMCTTLTEVLGQA